MMNVDVFHELHFDFQLHGIDPILPLYHVIVKKRPKEHTQEPLQRICGFNSYNFDFNNYTTI